MQTVTKAEPYGLPPIGLKERCDRCNARAYVSVRVHSTKSLLHFCAHHFSQHEEVLFGCATDIRDERQMLMAES